MVETFTEKKNMLFHRNYWQIVTINIILNSILTNVDRLLNRPQSAPVGVPHDNA